MCPSCSLTPQTLQHLGLHGNDRGPEVDCLCDRVTSIPISCRCRALRMNQVGSALDSFFSSPQCQIYVPNISPMKGAHEKDHFSIKLRKMALCRRRDKHPDTWEEEADLVGSPLIINVSHGLLKSSWHSRSSSPLPWASRERVRSANLRVLVIHVRRCVPMPGSRCQIPPIGH